MSEQVFDSRTDKAFEQLVGTCPWYGQPWAWNGEIDLYVQQISGFIDMRRKIDGEWKLIPVMQIDSAGTLPVTPAEIRDLGKQGLLRLQVKSEQDGPEKAIWVCLGNGAAMFGNRMVKHDPSSGPEGTVSETPANEFFHDPVDGVVPIPADVETMYTDMDAVKWWTGTQTEEAMGTTDRFQGPTSGHKAWNENPGLVEEREYSWGNPWWSSDLAARTFVIDLERVNGEKWMGNAFDWALDQVNGEHQFPTQLDMVVTLAYAPGQGRPAEFDPMREWTDDQLQTALDLEAQYKTQKAGESITGAIGNLATKEDLAAQTKEIVSALK